MAVSISQQASSAEVPILHAGQYTTDIEIMDPKMELNDWTSAEFDLKTDTLAALGCLPKSMADNDDDDFIFNAANNDLLPGLPPVSELRAELSTLYGDCGQPFAEDTKDFYSGYDSQTNSQFTTLTNAPQNGSSTASVLQNNITSANDITAPNNDTNQDQSTNAEPQYFVDPRSFPAMFPGTTDYFQEVYTPSGRQSSSFFPSDLQQVTPTIQDLGDSIPPVGQIPVPVAVSSQNDNTFDDRNLCMQQATIQDIGGGLSGYDDKQQPLNNYNQNNFQPYCDQDAAYQQQCLQDAIPQQPLSSDAAAAMDYKLQAQLQIDDYQNQPRDDYQQSSYDYQMDPYRFQDLTTTSQMLHDALEYIAPEVVSENRDSLFNPISALTNVLLENNFDMQTQEDYNYRYEGVPEDIIEEVPARRGIRRNIRKKDLPKLLDVIRVFRCKVCGFRSSDRIKAVRHTIEAHSKPKLNRKALYACGACHNHFATLEACGKHIGEKHPGINTAVLKEGKLYKQMRIEPKQLSKVRPEDIVQSQKMAWKRKLHKEQGLFVTDFNLRCEFRGCSIRFRAEDTHRYHLRCHLPHPSAEERFHCPVQDCTIGSKYWSTLANHLWNAHHIDIELQACNRCDFKTYSLANLEKVHKLIHSEVKQFECDKCHAKFRTIKQLRNHQYYTHSETTKTEEYKAQRKAKCPECQQEMFKKNLTSHIATVHQLAPPERVCPICDFRSNHSARLKQHIKGHEGTESMLCCQECGFLTSDHNIYRKHVAQHTGDKPYKCSWCPYGSIQATTFKQHLKRKHPDKAGELILHCDQCKFNTISELRLKQHNAKCHPEKRIAAR